MTRITPSLKVSEKNALIKLASQEQRDPCCQVALIIRRELEQRRLLTESPSTGQQTQKLEPVEVPNGSKPHS
jgi:hypothetical protein